MLESPLSHGDSFFDWAAPSWARRPGLRRTLSVQSGLIEKGAGNGSEVRLAKIALFGGFEDRKSHIGGETRKSEQLSCENVCQFN